MAGVRKDDVGQIIGFLSRVVPRGDDEANRLAALIRRLQKSLTDGKPNP